MRLSLCNEVLRELDFPAQCRMAAELGYDGIEFAPFTVSDQPQELDSAAIAGLRRTVEDAGLVVTGLHWLLVKPDGLSITSPDEAVRERTKLVLARLVDMCAELGGRVLVHGSPAQRQLEPGDEAEGRKRALDCLAHAARAAEKVGVTYCIEPLAETNFVCSVAEGAAVVDEIGSPALRTMLDCSAAARAEKESIPALLDRWLPSGHIAHVQVNDANRRGPGEGEGTFAPVLAKLKELGYRGDVAVEPFDYIPDGPCCAARSIGYLKGILEALP